MGPVTHTSIAELWTTREPQASLSKRVLVGELGIPNLEPRKILNFIKAVGLDEIFWRQSYLEICLAIWSLVQLNSWIIHSFNQLPRLRHMVQLKIKTYRGNFCLFHSLLHFEVNFSNYKTWIWWIISIERNLDRKNIKRCWRSEKFKYF